MKLSRISTKDYLSEWATFSENIQKASPINLAETPMEKKNRIKKLEADPEEWFKYYFLAFYTSEPAPFHILATRRIIKNPEWMEVRSWSRELAKTSRTMMEVLYLMLTGKKSNMLMVSDSYDNAERFLLPYKATLEYNNRIINDYGTQKRIGSWESGEFTTKGGLAFRAIGAGQNPRGTKNGAKRPDIIVTDDIDTDAECRNKKLIKAKLEWINEALLGTRAISEDLLFIGCGNIIAKFCCITELGKKADKHEVVNITDKNGISTWPQKNSQERIERIRSKIPERSFQKEYRNNPQSEGSTFKKIKFGKCPKPSKCERMIVYADPATSNSDKSGSYKAVAIIGLYKGQYFVYKIWIDQVPNSTFIGWLFLAYKFLLINLVIIILMYIENNTLQAPFYEQVLKPLIKEKSKTLGSLPLKEDKRKKGGKFDRIDATLEPINSNGDLIFNEDEKDDPGMITCIEQMLDVQEDSTTMDAPDAIEGGVSLIQKRERSGDGGAYSTGQNENRHF